MVYETYLLGLNNKIIMVRSSKKKNVPASTLSKSYKMRLIIMNYSTCNSNWVCFHRTTGIWCPLDLYTGVFYPFWCKNILVWTKIRRFQWFSGMLFTIRADPHFPTLFLHGLIVGGHDMSILHLNLSYNRASYIGEDCIYIYIYILRTNRNIQLLNIGYSLHIS